MPLPRRGAERTDEIKRRLREFILEHLLVGETEEILTDTTPLVSGGVIDSLSSLEVGMFLEAEFDVALSPEELADPQRMETIDAIASLVSRKVFESAGKGN